MNFKRLREIVKIIAVVFEFCLSCSCECFNFYIKTKEQQTRLEKIVKVLGLEKVNMKEENCKP